MRAVPICLMTLTLGFGPAMAQDQSGRFAVFGPSAEREAFFQGQRDQEAERVARLEEQRREAELARQLARQQAEAEQAAQPQYRRIVRRCFLTEPEENVVVRNNGDSPFAVRVRESNLPSRIRCPRYVFVPGKPYGSAISLTLDDGDLSGNVRIRRPGLNINLSAD